MNNYRRGKYAEFLARLFMRIHGYRIVAKNYITGRGTTAGEIDFVACRGKTLAFIEVKQRTSIANAAYAISITQQKRLIRGAQNFIKNNPQYAGYDVRFDAILIRLPFSICHIQNAWTQ